eukprot:254756-Pleurochrysis_carterae.AAC.4
MQRDFRLEEPNLAYVAWQADRTRASASQKLGSDADSTLPSVIMLDDAAPEGASEPHAHAERSGCTNARVAERTRRKRSTDPRKEHQQETPDSLNIDTRCSSNSPSAAEAYDSQLCELRRLAPPPSQLVAPRGGVCVKAKASSGMHRPRQGQTSQQSHPEAFRVAGDDGLGGCPAGPACSCATASGDVLAYAPRLDSIAADALRAASFRQPAFLSHASAMKQREKKREACSSALKHAFAADRRFSDSVARAVETCAASAKAGSDGICGAKVDPRAPCSSSVPCVQDSQQTSGTGRRIFQF